jgi:hypothetical protein
MDLFLRGSGESNARKRSIDTLIACLRIGVLIRRIEADEISATGDEGIEGWSLDQCSNPRQSQVETIRHALA